MGETIANLVLPGQCVWNGNEIVLESDPERRGGIAGLSPDSPDEWGVVFAAAPSLFAAFQLAIRSAVPDGDGGWHLNEKAAEAILAAVERAETK